MSFLREVIDAFKGDERRTGEDRRKPAAPDEAVMLPPDVPADRRKAQVVFGKGAARLDGDRRQG